MQTGDVRRMRSLVPPPATLEKAMRASLPRLRRRPPSWPCPRRPTMHRPPVRPPVCLPVCLPRCWTALMEAVSPRHHWASRRTASRLRRLAQLRMLPLLRRWRPPSRRLRMPTRRARCKTNTHTSTRTHSVQRRALCQMSSIQADSISDD